MTRCNIIGAGVACLLTAAAVLTGCSKSAVEPEGSASPLRVRMMSGSEYTETIANLFGRDIADAVPAPLPPMRRTNGLLASGAAGAGVHLR